MQYVYFLDNSVMSHFFFCMDVTKYKYITPNQLIIDMYIDTSMNMW